MNNTNICIIGNLNIDIIIRNVPSLPVWGHEIVGDSHIIVSSGQAGYLGFALSKLKYPVSIIANLGEDLYGQNIRSEMEAFNINTQGVEFVPDGQTCICVAIGRTDGERAFVSNYASLADFDKSLVMRHWDIVESASLVCLVGTATLENFTFEQIIDVAQKARQAGKTTMLDTGWYPNNFDQQTVSGIKSLLKHISIFIPNMDEAQAITGRSIPQEAVKMLCSYGPDIVVIKCGDQGSIACDHNQIYRVPAIPTTALDAVGAGDVYNAGFLYGYLGKMDISSCMTIGSAAASLYISKMTDRFPDLNDVLALASKHIQLPKYQD